MAKTRKRRTKEDLEEMAARAPAMTILSDGPLLGERWTDDSFVLEQRLGAVFDILRHANTTTPMAVALYGDWGTGKTSAMRWLDRCPKTQRREA